MPKLTLHYFDFDGGRGEPARLALHIGGVAFEDRRIPGPEWAKVKDQTPLRALPVLEVDGRSVTQSNAINRYVGRMTGLYPKDELQAMLADEILDAVEDLNMQLGTTIAMDDAQKKKVREEMAGGSLARHLQHFEARLKAAGGEFFADRRLTVADLKMLMLVRWLRSGMLDHIPKDLVDRVAPALVKHAERVSAHPKVKAYYQARKKG